MKKTKLLAAAMLFATLTFSANASATEAYEDHCKACHMIKPMMDKQKMMSMSQEERMSMKQKMMKMMKAPPMSKVSAKLKSDFKDDKAAFVAFVKDYIVNPSKEKAHCMPMALERFGVMPAIGKKMSENEIEEVANWLHDNFTEKWDSNDMGMMCNVKNRQDMKCGQGKCGGMMKKAAPAPSKCGAAHQNASDGKCAGDKTTSKKEEAMKCAAGKCGSK